MLFSLNPAQFRNLFHGTVETPMRRDDFVFPESPSAFVEFFDGVEWLFSSEFWSHPYGTYKGFVVGFDDDDGRALVCCKGLHNYPFFAYDACIQEDDPESIAQISRTVKQETGSSWEELLSWYGGHCKALGLVVDRDYESATAEFRRIMPEGLALSGVFDDVVAYYNGWATHK